MVVSHQQLSEFQLGFFIICFGNSNIVSLYIIHIFVKRTVSHFGKYAYPLSYRQLDLSCVQATYEATANISNHSFSFS